ncbi:MAG TPA: MarR family transcriptional regulator [Desulfobacteria bacterium]|nr:MarR family transcriptional regulator [Desulfobacteria bacterium]
MGYTEQAEMIAALLAKINKNIHRVLARHIESFGLNVSQLMVLRAIFLARHLSISELSERIGLTSSTVSGIIDRLEKEGYVFRQRDKLDRRVVYVSLTEKSRALKEQIPLFRPNYAAGWIGDLAPEKVNQIIESLAILADRIQ